jgi:membrane-associated phospholipid phosphatase
MVARRVWDRLRAVGLPLAFALAVLTIGAWAFGAVAEEVAEGDTTATDQRVADWLHGRATDPFTDVFRAVTWTGNGGFLALVALLAAVVLLRRRLVTDALFVVLAFAGAEVITFGMKQGFRRQRPFFEDPLATASSFSFPSGHSLVSLAVYGSVALVVARRARRRWFGAAAVIAAAIWILAIGFSRLYLGVHFLTDVVAGYAAGAAWLALLYLALEARSRYTSRYRASTNE